MPADSYTIDLAAWQTERAMERGEIPFDQVDRASSLLADYNARVSAEGRERFSAYHERQAQESERIRGYYLKPDNGIDAEQRAQLDDLTKNSANPDEERAMQFNAAFLAHRYNEDPANIASRYPLYRADYALREMENEKATDAQVFEHVKASYELQDLLGKAAKDSVLSGESALVGFTKFVKGNETHAAFNAKKAAEFRQRFNDTRNAIEEKIAPYKGIVTATLNDIERLYGTEKAKAGEPENLAVLAHRLLSVPKPDRELVLNVIADTAELRGTDIKGFVKQMGESFARGSEKLGAGIIEGVATNALAFVPVSPVSEDELDAVDLMADLREIAERKVDPVKGDYLVTRGLYGAAESLPYTLTAVVPYVGVPATMQAMATDNYHRMRRENPGMDRGQARALAQIAAVPQAVLERIEGRFLTGKMPTLGAFLNRAVTPRAGGLARLGIRAAEQTGAEMVTENLQDLTPAFVQELAGAMSADVPDVNWSRTLEQFSGKNQAELLATIIPLSIIGAGAGTWQDVRGSRELLSNEALLRPFLNNDAQASAVRVLALRGDMTGAARLFNETAGPKLKAGLTLHDAGTQALEAVRQNEARRQAAREQALSYEVDAPTMKRTETGWQLQFTDGSESVPYDTHAEADAARWQHTYDRQGLKPVELMRQIFARSETAQMTPGDVWQRSFDLMPLDTGDSAKMAKEGLADATERLKRRKQQSDALMSGATVDEDFALAAATVGAIAPTESDAQAGQWILGTNKVEFTEGVRRITTKMFGGGDDVSPLTALEEDAETEAKTILAREGGQAWMLSSLREFEAVTGEKLFRTKVNSDLHADDYVEAFSHMAVAVFAGESMRGKSPAHAAMATKQFRKQLQSVFNLRVNGVVSAMAQKWQAAFRRAAAIQKAQAEGKMKGELSQAIARAAGLSDQEQHERGVVKEASKIRDDARETFSTVEDYGGNHRPNSQGPRAFDLSEEDMMPADVYEHPEWYSSSDSDKGTRETMRQLRAVRGKPDAMLTIYRASPKGEFNSGDWITLSKEYAKTHAMGQSKADDMPVWSAQASAKDVRWSMDDLAEFGYFGGDTITAKEAGKMAGDAGGEAGTVTFSTVPIDQQLSGMFSPFHRSPELRRKLGVEMQRRAIAIGATWEEIASRKHGKGELDAEQKRVYQQSLKELLEGAMATLSPETLMAFHSDTALGDAREDPLISAMIVRDAKAIGGYRGRMAHPSIVTENAINEYDDMPSGLPRWMFGGLMTPDQLAQELHEQGLINDPYPATLWQAVERAFTTASQLKEQFKRAREGVKGIEIAARKTAKSEAQAWRDEQDALQPSDRQRLIAAIRTLDAITVALPPEVRARVGGYAKLAELSTDAKRVEFIGERVKKIDALLERWLRKELREQIETLFEKSKPDAEAGKKIKGKLGADTHAIIAHAEAASKMDAMGVAGEIAKLDSAIASGDLTAEQEAVAIRTRELIQLVGNMKHADAARLDAALDALTMTRGEGFMEWSLQLIAKREARQAAREALVADTGKTGAKPERDAQRERAGTLLGKARDRMLSLSSFSEVMRYIFGEKSAQARAIIDAEREASNQKEDAMQALADETDDLFTALAGSPIKGEKLRYDLSQVSIRTAKASLSQLEAIQALLMWRQEDGQRHMIGQLDENGKPAGAWNYDQAWIDEIAAALTPEAREVMRFIQEHYANEWEHLNPAYRERHGVNMPRNKNYAPLTVAPVQASSGEMIDPVSGAVISGSILTPGSLRTRNTNAVAEPRFPDALRTLIAHKAQMEHWLAYYDLAVDAQAIIGNRDVGNAIEAAGGDKGKSALRQWADYFAQGGVRDAGAMLATNEAMSRGMSRAASMALFGRVSTLLIQSTQLAAASVKMPVTAYVSRLGRLFSGKLSWGSAIKSPFIQRRIKQMPPIVRQAMAELGAATKPNVIKHAKDALGKLLSGADGLFTAGTYAILYDYHLENAQALGMGDTDAEAFAHNEAARDTEEVAQPTRAANRSLAELTNTNPLGRLMWAFASESRQKLMLTAWAAKSAKGNKAKAAKTAFLTFVVGGLGAQVLRNLWREAKGDDDEDKWSAKRLTIATVAAPLSGIPGFDMMTGKDGLFGRVAYAPGAAVDLATFDEPDAKAAWRDAQTLLWSAGMFNDTAAAVGALVNAGEESARLLHNLFTEE